MSSQKPKYLYHSSHKNIKGNYLLPFYSPLVKKKVVFATHIKAMTLKFAGEKWTDNDFSSGRIRGIEYMMPRHKDAVKKLDTHGYIYTISSEGFYKINNREWIKEEKVKILRRRKIKNVLNALKRHGVKIPKYENLKRIYINKKPKEKKCAKLEISNLNMDKIMEIIENIKIKHLCVKVPKNKINKKDFVKYGIFKLNNQTFITSRLGYTNEYVFDYE